MVRPSTGPRSPAGFARSVLEPFLAGVLAEDTQETSRRFVDLLLRMFVRGVPALPRDGMQALPQQVADLLPAGTVRLRDPGDLPRRPHRA